MNSKDTPANSLIYSALRDWYRQPLGQHLGASEQALLSEYLANVFGYHLLLVAPPWESLPLDSSRIRHRSVLYACAVTEAPAEALYGCPEALPVTGDTLDVLILPHTLELSADPHQVLREADRCLIPEGYLFIIGFNPMGLWGLRRLIHLKGRKLPWTVPFIRLSRVKDWLALLGFDTVRVKPLFFRPPVQSPRLLERLRLMEGLERFNRVSIAGAYLVVARKRVIAVTPLRSRWRPRRLVTPGFVEPTHRGYSRGR